jgi:xylulokinase
MNASYILAFDLGTGGNKAVLYDREGNLVAKAFVPYETFYPRSGWAEQSPLDWWKSITESTRKMLSQSGADKSRIGCISISGHGIGVVPVDKKGSLLRGKTLLWSDSRALAQIERMFQRVDELEWYRTTGFALRPENCTAAKIMWHRDNEPDIYDRAYKFIGTKDFINLKMTGELVSDYSDASFSGVYDLVRWKYSQDLIGATGIPMEKFPELRPSTHVLGGLLPGPAEELGLVKGVPVVAGGYDGSCTALGAGNVKEDRVYNYIGSSSWISVASDKPLLKEAIRPYVYAHVIPEMFNSTVSIYSAGSSYQWVRNTVCGEEVAAAKAEGVDPYELMERLASKSPLGSNGLFFNPSLMGGATVYPNPHLRGGYVGLGLSHTKSDLIRAAMEGIALDLRMVLDEFRNMGVKAREIRVVGGGANSPLWRNIFADIYRARIIRTTVGQEAAALGAATVGAVGTGLWRDFSVIDEIGKAVDISEPCEENSVKYDEQLAVHRFITEKLLEIAERVAGRMKNPG